MVDLDLEKEKIKTTYILDNEPMTIFAGQNVVRLSGEPGTFILSGDNILIPDQSYYGYNSDIKLNAWFIDGNMESQNLDYNIVLADLYTTPDIEVYSLVV